jgi:predicted RNA-binding protein with PUA-like domain
MNVGDMCLFYHSNEGKAVVGLARVSRTAYPDPTSVDGEWSAVDIEPVRALGRPVSLDEMRRNAVIGKMTMMRRPRLSVVPVTKSEFDAVVALSRAKAPT